MGRPPLALAIAGAIRWYKTHTGYRARVSSGTTRAGYAASNGALGPSSPPSAPWSRPCVIAPPARGPGS